MIWLWPWKRRRKPRFDTVSPPLSEYPQRAADDDTVALLNAFLSATDGASPAVHSTSFSGHGGDFGGGGGSGSY